MTEYQAESTFKHYSYFYGGARHTCYTSIAAAGSSGSIFHYGHAGAANDQPLRDGDMVSRASNKPSRSSKFYNHGEGTY